MSIRIKMGLIVLCAVLCFGVAEYSVQKLIVLPGFSSLEEDAAITGAARVVNAINNEIKQLRNLTGDWSAWDDTYEFVQTRSLKYIASNLVFSTFTGNQLNLIYIWDTQGSLIWGKTYDLTEKKEIQANLFSGNALAPDHPLFAGNGKDSSIPPDITGIWVTPAGPLLVSAAPILTSNGKGPSRGTLIMGRFLDAAAVAQIADQTQVNFSTALAEQPPGASLQERGRPSSATAPDRYRIDIINENQLNVHCRLQDISGDPAIDLTAHVHRKISQKGSQAMHNSLLAIFAAGMAVAILVLLGLTKTILQPISKLTRHVRDIRQTGDLSKRIYLTTKDEIGLLAKEFDAMIARIEQITRENMEISARLREENEKRKAEEEKIQQERKMEAITTLTAGIAHNFNNLLTVILGSAELAASKISKDNPATGFLKKIEHAGNQAKEIVWQLIQFSQKVEKNFRPVSMDAVVEEEIQALNPAAKGDIKLIRQLSLDGASVFGDPDQLRIMVTHLLTNAMESIKNGRGIIEVQMENITHGTASDPATGDLKEDNHICLTIRDNGRGIDPRHLDRIFDPYFTTKDFSKGAGMGLAVVRGLVLNHNGSITVDSRVDKGTEIKVCLPAITTAG